MSLARACPGRWWVPAGLAGSLALLITGMVLPVMRVETLVFWTNDFTILTGIRVLWEKDHRFLAAIILVFSVVFPLVKSAGLLAVWFFPLPHVQSARAVRFIDLLGRWSMLDVYVVAVTVVLASSKAALDASPRAGLYVFAGGVAASMLMSLAVERSIQLQPATIHRSSVSPEP